MTSSVRYTHLHILRILSSRHFQRTPRYRDASRRIAGHYTTAHNARSCMDIPIDEGPIQLAGAKTSIGRFRKNHRTRVCIRCIINA